MGPLTKPPKEIRTLLMVCGIFGYVLAVLSGMGLWDLVHGFEPGEAYHAVKYLLALPFFTALFFLSCSGLAIWLLSIIALLFGADDG